MSLIVSNLLRKRKMSFCAFCFKYLKSAWMSLIMLHYMLLWTGWQKIVPKLHIKYSNNGFKLLLSVKKGYYKQTMKDVPVWLSCYVYIFAISTNLTTVNQCLTIYCSKSYLPLNRSPLDKTRKSIKPLKK